MTTIASELGEPATAPRWHRWLLPAVIVAVAALVGGYAAWYVFAVGPEEPGRQITYNSTEIFGAAPGGRLVIFPKEGVSILRGWGLPLSPPSAGVYQLWAIEPTGPRRLVSMTVDGIGGLTAVVPADLSTVETVIVTEDPPGALVPSAPIITIVR